MSKIILLLIIVLPTYSLAGGMIDDPLLTMVKIDQLELRAGSGSDPLAWDVEGWIGKDLNKLWIKSDGEYLSGDVEDMEIQALYSRAVAPFWDLQVGWRHDVRPTPQRDWLVLGVKGLAPYFFDIDTALFVGESGQIELRLQAEYEIMFTQRLILVPEFEVNLYGKDDLDTGIGSGLADIETGLRLRYEIRREFAPYLGVNWLRLYGNSADFARGEGNAVDDFRFVFGVRTWF